MRVLVTNDDGVRSAGMHVLACALVDEGHDVVCAAPMEDLSGSGAAIGRVDPDERIHARRATLPGAEGVTAYALDGPPGLAVMAAGFGAFGDPFDAVCSGINAGLNTGRLVLHSGTVGAVLTAQNFRLSGLAVSLEQGEPFQWQTAGRIAVDVLAWLESMEAGTALNLNVPDRLHEDVLGVEWAKLDRLGVVQTATVGAEDETLQFTVTGKRRDPDPGTDTALVGEGYATVTALAGVTEADGRLGRFDPGTGRRKRGDALTRSPRR